MSAPYKQLANDPKIRILRGKFSITRALQRNLKKSKLCQPKSCGEEKIPGERIIRIENVIRVSIRAFRRKACLAAGLMTLHYDSWDIYQDLRNVTEGSSSAGMFSMDNLICNSMLPRKGYISMLKPLTSTSYIQHVETLYLYQLHSAC